MSTLYVPHPGLSLQGLAGDPVQEDQQPQQAKVYWGLLKRWSSAQAAKADRTGWSLEELPLAYQLTPHRRLIFPGSLLDIPPQDLSNNGLGFQVPACVRIRVSGGRPPACLFSQAVYIYRATPVPSAALCLILLGISRKQTLALGSFSVI